MENYHEKNYYYYYEKQNLFGKQRIVRTAAMRNGTSDSAWNIGQFGREQSKEITKSHSGLFVLFLFRVFLKHFLTLFSLGNLQVIRLSCL